MFAKLAALVTLFTVISQTSARPHYYPMPYMPQPPAHHAVLENEAQEAHFPDHLRNPFYKTPRVSYVLARFSGLHHGETPVQNRIADAVPRKEIFKLLAHAGFISREDFPYA